MMYTLTRDGEDYDLEIAYHRAPRIPAIPRGWDEPGEPESGGDVTLQVAWLGGETFLLTDAEIAKIEEQIYGMGE